MIIGVTDEASDLVDAFVAKRKPTYPVVILKNDALENALDVPHFPYNGVIDTTGKLVYAGDSPQSAIGKSMKETKAGPIWPKKLVKAAQALRVPKFVDAWNELDAVGRDPALDAREKSVHARFKAYIEAQVAAELAAAQRASEAGFVYAAVQHVEPLTKADPPLPIGEEATKLLAELKATPKLDVELKGGEAFVAADKSETAGEYLAAFDGFKSIVKKYPGTKIGPLAFERAKSLLDRGMPGFGPNCPKCQKAKRACAKHAEDVKL